jgi:hypothetical protein
MSILGDESQTSSNGTSYNACSTPFMVLHRAINKMLE